MTKSETADYPYFREIYPEVSINCYTGCVQSLLKAQGIHIPEYIIWTLGKGFILSEGEDEYGDPAIFFDQFQIVNEFSKIYNFKLDSYDIQYDNFHQQIVSFLDKKKQLLVWVNSHYLIYSDLYYSNKGYLHCIVLESINHENSLVRVRDNLIVSVPAWSCIADLPFEYLVKGVSDRVRLPLEDVMGTFHTLTIEKEPPNITTKLLRDSLQSTCSQIVADIYHDKSVIIKYGERCWGYIEKSDDDKKLWMLGRINDYIKTLYVLPNRIALGKVLENIELNCEDYNELKARLNDVLTSWTILANLCLKCYVSKRTRDLDMLPGCFEEVKKSEEIFWVNLNKILGRYDG
jgi:hypothetical protein